MSDIYIQGESLHVDNKVDRVKIEGINETFESLKPKILRVGGGGGASALNDLTDVEISTPTSGQILKYDEQNDKWVNGEEFLAPAIYSTNEREIGVWTDGKPLYQKTWVFDSVVILAHQAWTNTPIRCSDYSFDSIVNVASHLTTTGAAFLFIAATPDNEYLRIFSTRNIDFSINALTIQYTKTTDVAGSGTWTPSGIPAVHYDGNEKVIGTWFGRTLYEKTIWYVSPNDQHDDKTIIDATIKNGVNCYVIDITGIQTFGYLNNSYHTTNEYSDAEPLSQRQLHLSYYDPSALESSGYINCDRDGIHFTKKMGDSKANSVIITVRYIKRS